MNQVFFGVQFHGDNMDRSWIQFEMSHPRLELFQNLTTECVDFGCIYCCFGLLCPSCMTSVHEFLHHGRKDEPELARELLLEIPLRVERTGAKGVSHMKIGFRNHLENEEAFCQFPTLDLGT
jgi:hypothetical protein